MIMLKPLLLSFGLLAAAAAQAQSSPDNVKPKEESKTMVTEAKGEQSKSGSPQVVMSTNMGDMTIELYPDKAPKTVENFLQYVKEGHYDGTIFHRVIKNFMIQGGGFTQELAQKPTRDPIANEANNGISNAVGTIAMARTNVPHSATAQFFINVVDNARLDYVGSENGTTWGYCVFGKVVSGMDVAERIRNVETGPAGPFASDVPKSAVTINSVKLVEQAQP